MGWCYSLTFVGNPLTYRAVLSVAERTKTPSVLIGQPSSHTEDTSNQPLHNGFPNTEASCTSSLAIESLSMASHSLLVASFSHLLLAAFDSLIMSSFPLSVSYCPSCCLITSKWNKSLLTECLLFTFILDVFLFWNVSFLSRSPSSFGASQLFLFRRGFSTWLLFSQFLSTCHLSGCCQTLRGFSHTLSGFFHTLCGFFHTLGLSGCSHTLMWPLSHSKQLLLHSKQLLLHSKQLLLHSK